MVRTAKSAPYLGNVGSTFCLSFHGGKPQAIVRIRRRKLLSTDGTMIMILLREFSDADLNTIRKSIFTFTGIYVFFWHFKGFHIQPGGFFETVSGEPLRFAAPEMLYGLALVLAYLVARIILIGRAEWYSKNRFSMEGGLSSIPTISDFQQHLNDFSEDMQKVSIAMSGLSEQLERTEHLEQVVELRKPLEELIGKIRTKLTENNEGFSSDFPHDLQRTIDGWFASVGDFKRQRIDAQISFGKLEMELQELTRDLNNLSNKPLRSEIGRFLKLLRSDTIRSGKLRKISFVTTETALPFVLAVGCILHALWLSIGPVISLLSRHF